MKHTKQGRTNIIKAVCDRLIEGESLRKICTDNKMPSKSTILRWINEDTAFSTIIAQARVLQADGLDDDIQDVINDIKDGTIDPNAGRVVIWGLQWRASKLRPKRYGDKLDIDTSVKVSIDVVRYDTPAIECEQVDLIEDTKQG